MRESQIEKYLCERVKALGGLCWKFVSPNLRGVPDRIVVHNTWVFFVELKSPGEKPRESQMRRMQELRRNGASTRVLDSKEAVDNFVKDLQWNSIHTRTSL